MKDFMTKTIACAILIIMYFGYRYFFPHYYECTTIDGKQIVCTEIVRNRGGMLEGQDEKGNIYLLASHKIVYIKK